MSDAEELAFATEFPAATREHWLKLVDGVLKGAPFDKRLVAKTYDGLSIQPLYPRDAGAKPVAARAPGAAGRSAHPRRWDGRLSPVTRFQVSIAWRCYPIRCGAAASTPIPR